MNMNTGTNVNALEVDSEESPGMQLAKLREKRGFSQEYVAGKLHLRVKIIDLLETDNYELLPEPVFIKGYMRAYAKLLNVPYEPFLDFFNRLNIADRKVEKALWQGRRESNAKEKMVRWFSLSAVIVLIILAAFWWQKNNEPPLLAKNTENTIKKKLYEAKTDKKLSTLSKIQSMFAAQNLEPQNTEIKRG